MTTAQLLMLAAFIYIAPHVPTKMALGIGIFYVVMSVLTMFMGVK